MCNKFDFAVPSEQSLLRSSQQIYFLIERDSTRRVTSPRLVQTGKVIYYEECSHIVSKHFKFYLFISNHNLIYYRWMKGHSRTGVWIIVGFPTV